LFAVCGWLLAAVLNNRRLMYAGSAAIVTGGNE
jgi:hypothetical protein